MNQTHPGKYSRSVSIIGVGCTPFMYTVDNPETDGLTEGEMFGYAALKAMEDAGLEITISAPTTETPFCSQGIGDLPGKQLMIDGRESS